LKLRLLGGLAGILLGTLATALWFAVPHTPSSLPDAPDGVRTLSGVELAGSSAGKLSEKGDALSKIIEVRLRAKEFGKALDLLKRVNTLTLSEQAQIYRYAADVVLKPALPGAENGEKYFMENGGKEAVLERLPYLYTMARQVADSPVKVTLLLRMRNIYDFVGMGKGVSVGASQALPGAETLMGEASRIAHALPSEAYPWLPWGVGCGCTVVLGLIGVVLGEMILECARCFVQEFAKEYGLGRFKKIKSEEDSGAVAAVTERMEATSAQERVLPAAPTGSPRGGCASVASSFE